jgi:hypothetical protein
MALLLLLLQLQLLMILRRGLGRQDLPSVGGGDGGGVDGAASREPARGRCCCTMI